MGHPAGPGRAPAPVRPRPHRPVGRPVRRAARDGDRRAARAGARFPEGAARDRRRHGASGCAPLALVAARRRSARACRRMVLFRPAARGCEARILPSVAEPAPAGRVDGGRVLGDGQVANVASIRAHRAGRARDVARRSWRSLCTALALGGPVLVVRRWLERFGIYVLLALGGRGSRRGRLSVSEISGRSGAQPGEGGLPFWLAVDLVIVMPSRGCHWWPTTRGSRGRRQRRIRRNLTSATSSGTCWFYALGALLVLGAAPRRTSLGVGTAIVGAAGGALAAPRAPRGRERQRVRRTSTRRPSRRRTCLRRPAAGARGRCGRPRRSPWRSRSRWSATSRSCS